MGQDAISQYLLSFVPETSGLIQEMEQYAAEHGVPIMDRLGMEFMLQMLRLIEPKRILEIGAAIGYSAIRMAQAFPDAHIVTIERDEERYAKAVQYIGDSEAAARIALIQGDALETGEQVKQHGTFDVIFIDAAKGQYQRFFELYAPLLREKGVIITDNVIFRGLVAEENIENKRMRSLVRKIRTYNEWLMAHPDYDTTIFPIGDGVAVSKKKG
ncbi:O-methyltransferase [Ectobacillus ponti]|uniref:tRNA 5-hydroxyuridine methyltransferase n=1 Tax=Ectobacillus ponti TaxID=2961894 RepID=A0AA41X4Y0_9BACI|nr:O-methyltransferase [Ectobacillus ponti]MCP8967263.1 O-methyltransferase [Ectobacillus ponti]